MSITINYEYLQSDAKSLRQGTSTDYDTLKKVFGTKVLNTGDVDKLRAMHAATGRGDSIWKELADLLDKEDGVSIRLWGTY